MKKLSLTILTGLTASLLIVPSVMAATPSVASSTTETTTPTAAQQTRLAEIKSKGDAEISRRLSSLSELSAKISSATRLSAANQATLSSEVSAEITGLNNLKTQLDSATTLAAAISSAQSIISGYRVYALILPKVWLISAADSQATAESKLSSLATTLQARITTAKAAGKDVTAVQNQLDSLVAQITAAQAISMAVEQKVLPLQPSDYNIDHTILEGQLSQLKQAHADNRAAYAAAKMLVAAIKAL